MYYTVFEKQYVMKFINAIYICLPLLQSKLMYDVA